MKKRQERRNRACTNCRNANRGTRQERRPLADHALPGRGNPEGVTSELNKRGAVKKRLFLTAGFLLTALGAFAQNSGVNGITQATTMVSSYFDPATKLIYAIGAVVGLIGGVKVYGKFSSGDPDTSKTAASWFGACIFLIVAATILRSFFL